jgi:hypothetical protein
MLFIPGYYYIASEGQVKDAICALENDANLRESSSYFDTSLKKVKILENKVNSHAAWTEEDIQDCWKKFVHLDRSFAHYATVIKAIKWGLPRAEQQEALDRVNQAFIRAKSTFTTSETAIYNQLHGVSTNRKIPIPSNVQSVYTRQMYSGSRWSYSYRIFFTILASVIAAAAAAKLGYENEMRDFVKKACILTGQAAAGFADISLRTISFLVQNAETQTVILAAAGLWAASEITEWGSEKLGSLMREHKWISAALLTGGATAVALNEPLQNGIKYIATSKTGFQIGIISAAIASFTLAKKLVGPHVPDAIYDLGEQVSSIPRATFNLAHSIISQKKQEPARAEPPAVLAPPHNEPDSSP